MVVSDDSDDPYDYNKCMRLSFPSTVMQSWKSFYRNQEMVDITLLIGGSKTEFKAHKVVLCAHSDVLKKMLTSPMKEARENTIKFPEADETAFGALLEFFYTGNVPVDKPFICQLIELCDYLHIPNLKQHCCTWLHKNLVAEDACEYLMFSTKPSADEQLYKNCFQWIEDHAAKVLCTDGFAKHMTAEEVQKIVASNSLNLKEIQLFEGFKRWIEHDVSRREDGKEIAKFLRLPMMNVSDLMGCVKASGLVQSDAILEALESLLQPSVDNPYEINSLHANLRVPSARLASLNSPFVWKSSKPVSTERTISKSFNHTVVKGSQTLMTAEPLPIPSCVRIQLSTKSTLNRRATFGIVIVPRDTNSKRLTCGLNLNGSTLNTFPLPSSVLIQAGCIMALKFHVTTKHICIHLNGTPVTQIDYTKLAGSQFLSPNDGRRVYIMVTTHELQAPANMSMKRDDGTRCECESN